MKLLFTTLLAFSFLFTNAQIYKGENYNSKITFQFNNDKTTFYQDVIPTELKAISIHKKLIHLLPGIVTDTLNKIVFTQSKTLFIAEVLGNMPFEAKYILTIDIKDNKYRYTVSDITFIYKANKTPVSLFEEWNKCQQGRDYSNNLKRIYAFEDNVSEIKDQIEKALSKNDIVVASDF